MTQNAAHLETYPAPRVEVRPLLRNVYLWMTLALDHHRRSQPT